MPKTQISARVSEATNQKLKWLADASRYSTQTEALAVAIDQLYEKEQEKLPMSTNEENARDRVYNDPRLSPHADFILADWPEGEEHWEWVCSTSVDEILDWVAAGQ